MVFEAGDELVLHVLHASWLLKTMSVCRTSKMHVRALIRPLLEVVLVIENLDTLHSVY